jgi:hypothetical protein
MGRRPKPLIETVRRKRKRQLLERQLKSINFTATTYIKNIQAKLHRITITGNTTVEKIEEVIGPLYPNYDYYHRKDKDYDKMSETVWNGINFQVKMEPSKLFKPKLMIQFTPPEGILAKEYRYLLLKLKNTFDEFNLHTVEYAIDIYQPDRQLVDTLFWVLKKYLFISKKRIPAILYQKLEPSEETTAEESSTEETTNKTYMVSMFNKIYERGDDEDKENEGWNDKSINRVRLEHTSEREELLQYGLKLFQDLLADCKFVEINGDIWKFKKFDDSRKFPNSIHFYQDNDAFQDIYIVARKKGERPDKYIVDVDDEELFRLKRIIVDAMKSFDREWRDSV